MPLVFLNYQVFLSNKTTRIFVRFVAELDLDYLERRGVDSCEPEKISSASKEEDSPADTLERVKVIFLGATGVGKTSIIRVSYGGLLH